MKVVNVVKVVKMVIATLYQNCGYASLVLYNKRALH